MRRRGRFLMIFGVLLAVLAGVVTFVLLQQPKQEAPAPPTTTQIVVAVADIPVGSSMDPSMGELRDWPIDNVPEGALRNLADLSGKYAKTAIFTGQVIQSQMIGTSEQLAATGELASALIPEGMVAYPFPISELTGVAYALQPGDHVDALIAFMFVDVDQESQVVLPLIRGVEGEIQGNQIPRLASQLTLQNIEVLRVGSWYVPPATAPAKTTSTTQAASTPEPPGVVTLMLSQQDALVLQFARQAGAVIELALRNPNDAAIVDTDAVTLDYMMNRFNIDVPLRRGNSLQSLMPIQ